MYTTDYTDVEIYCKIIHEIIQNNENRAFIVDPGDVSSHVRRALRKLLVFKFQPLQQRATATQNCGKDRVLKLK